MSTCSNNFFFSIGNAIEHENEKSGSMLIDFFLKLRKASIPASITEYLSLLEAMDRGICELGVDDFYYLARASLIKDERHFERFDQVFGSYFKGKEALFDHLHPEVPAEWLRKLAERRLSEEEKAQVEALGGWENLMKTLRERLQEQRERHQGGNKWVGTAGTSPFGAYGYNPEGVRIGQEGSRHRRAVKVWDQRIYSNFDDHLALDNRGFKVALRRLRKFARESGTIEELDLDGTIHHTARNAGLLDVRMVPPRRNAVKVLLFFDSGGSMDDHIKTCEELFSAARGEFRHLEYFYFHNFIYESLWRDNHRRHHECTPLFEILRTYAADYKIIFVGDATMSPYEIVHPGGSVEHWNEEAGAIWMQRILARYPNAIWLNPEPKRRWPITHSIDIVRKLMGGRMYPLTSAGIDEGVRELLR